MVTLLNHGWSLLNLVLFVLFCADLQSRFNYQIWSLREFNDMLFAFLPTKSIYFLATSFSITTTTPAFSGESDHCGLRKMTLWKLDCGRKKGFDKALFSFMSLVCPFVFAPTQSTTLSIYCNLSWCFIAIFGSPLLYLSKLNHYTWLLILRK